MKLLEYEAKQLLRQYGLPVPEATLIRSADQKVDFNVPLVLKAQILKGGRGKAGGVKTVYTEAAFQKTVERLLGGSLLGCPVRSLLAEELLEIQRELYLAVMVDRGEQRLMLMAHTRGGVDIEATAQAGEPPIRLPLDEVLKKTGIQKLRQYFGLPEAELKSVEQLVTLMRQACIKEDALLIEVNPLVVTKRGDLVCADAKIELDDAAAFRHPDWAFETKPASAQFVQLARGGTVASMANGAGLAMATIDAIKAAGAEPANFFDVGGGTDATGMVMAFEKMNAMPQVRAIVVNIFGGITRCDEVATAIIKAKSQLLSLPPLFIRLTGTDERQGKKLLDEAGIGSLPTLAACVDGAVKEVNRSV